MLYVLQEIATIATPGVSVLVMAQGANVMIICTIGRLSGAARST